MKYKLKYSDIPINNSEKILKVINKVMTKFSTKYMIIGAVARSILIENIYKSDITRATKDLDISIMIKNWQEYDNIINEFINNYNYNKDKIKYHRLKCGSYIIDILPFGKIEKNNKIYWPPNFKEYMYVDFWNEIFKSSLKILVKENHKNIKIKIPSLEGFFLLKIVSWFGRLSSKDARDIKSILTVMKKEYQDLLFDKYYYLISDNYEYNKVFPFILFKELTKILDNKNLRKIFVNYLDDEKKINEQLIPNMLDVSTTREKNLYEEYINIFTKLKKELIKTI